MERLGTILIKGELYPQLSNTALFLNPKIRTAPTVGRVDPADIDLLRKHATSISTNMIIASAQTTDPKKARAIMSDEKRFHKFCRRNFQGITQQDVNIFKQYLP